MKNNNVVGNELPETKKEGVQIQSVARALDIIKCFADEPELGISDISEKMGLGKSTVYGLVNTLVNYGYLEQGIRHKKYRLGISLFELGNLVLSRIDVRNETKDACMPLAKKYKATVHIASHSRGEVIYIDKIDLSDSLISSSSVGRRAPMYCTGVGKVMLAYLPKEYLQNYVLNHPLRKLTKNTITTEKKLLEELKTVRDTGIAIDNEEIETGLTCIAAPIFKRDGDIELAVSLSFPFNKVKDVDQDEVKENLLACTRNISARLGYKG